MVELSPADCTALNFSGSIRELLRSATASDHAQVDQRFAPLLVQGFAGYREFLRLSAAAVLPLEQALVEAGVERILPDWTQRARGPSLRADLAELGIAAPSCAQPPAIGGEAYQFGMLYVLEGSRLGAKILLPNLAGHFPALRYLRHGEGQPLWPSFLKRLESSGAVRRSPDGAVAGAHAAFAWFGATAPNSQRDLEWVSA
jgi:heme oxygenase